MKNLYLFHIDISHLVSKIIKLDISRYLVVSLLNTILTFVIFTICLKLFLVGYSFSLFLCWLCGVVFSYCMNFVWVFDQKDKLIFDHRFRKFLFTGVISISINIILLREIVETTGYDPFWVQTGLMIPLAGFNFLAAKFWSLVRPSQKR